MVNREKKGFHYLNYSYVILNINSDDYDKLFYLIKRDR